MTVFPILFRQMDKRTSIYNRTDLCTLLPAQILLTFVPFRVCVVATDRTSVKSMLFCSC